MTNLHFLDLSNTKLHLVSSKAFNGLEKLFVLNLTNSRVSNLKNRALHNLQSLSALSIKLGNVSDMSVVFSNDSSIPIFDYITYIEADHSKFCCIADHVDTCQAPLPRYSCDGLLEMDIKRIFIWTSSFFIFMGNGFVLIYRAKMLFRTLSATAIIIFNLALSDMMMFVYLFGILIADIEFESSYLLHEKYWESSINCNILCYFANVSIMMSLYSLVFLSLFHILVIAYKKVLKAKSCILICIGMWICCGLWNLLGFFSTRKKRKIYCLQFVFRNHDWDYHNTAGFIFRNILLGLSICSCIQMIVIINKSTKLVEKEGKITGNLKRSRTFGLLLVQVVCNMLSRIPFEVLLFLALFFDISVSIIKWFIILVLPFNSLVNPFLYTIRNVLITSRKQVRMIYTSHTNFSSAQQYRDSFNTMEMKIVTNKEN